MNEYPFTLLTVSRAITTGTSGTLTQAPWSNLKTYEPIAMPGATLSTITLRDDDGSFQSSRYVTGEAGQTLTSAVTFGRDASPTPAGTQLSFHTSSVIQTRNPDGSFDQFLALFPRRYQDGAIGAELGGRFSVLLMPVARADGSFPVFDLSRPYSFTTVRPVGQSNTGTAYVPAAVPCFARGTLIQTELGAQRVELLRPGNLVLTRDHGHQPLRWVGSADVTPEGLEMRPNLRPILIRKDALGPDSPASDLVVSPQHRILVRSRIAHRLFENAEILVAAKHLTELPDIDVIVPPNGISYFHLLFDQHEIVLSNGAWTESLYTGQQALRSVGMAARREILSLFPELAEDRIPAPARRLLTGREAQRLAERQLRNSGKRRLVEPL